MKKYKLIDTVLGWVVFLIASTVYIMTVEPTASWWDCGEYIATADKLQVGHPPGAPTFQLIGTLFSNFAGGDVTKIALSINIMSALCSGFTILFLFWSITMLARKFVKQPENMTTAQMIAVFASGVIGSLAYTFSDTFWYSAVEGEVYAMSSCFTAIAFWIILKWEEQAEEANNLRWIILIAFIIGVSIGIHLLNLLTIPAIAYVYYFKKYPDVKTGKKKKFLLVGLISMAMVAAILYVIVPYIVILAGKFEIFFTNEVGLPFSSGTIIYFVLLAGLIAWGLMYSIRRQKVVLNTAILSILFIIIGYTTFFILVIRANANTPINENEPKDATALLTYLNREQYGYTPLFYGPYFNAQITGQKDGTPKYIKDEEQGKYVEVRQGGEVLYEEDKQTVFPRMYSNDNSRNHPLFYKMWSGMESDATPTFGENLKYFFRYQINHMYWRYFMWNFAGRQNDIQSFGLNYAGYEPSSVSNGTKDLIHGNWITGIDAIDAWRLGPQDNLPEDLANNKGKNRLYCLPLLLGLAGLVFHIKRRPKDAFVVFLLFFMTGLAIVLYLNQPPNQPRERDYAYAGSFYAFAIWIGVGVYALYEWAKKIKKLPETVNAVAVSVLCLFAVPVLMASQEWDDHDRSDRYMARDFARNYLESCEPNAILITFGDNDTFPLWYAQEVEGIRTDVRVLNYTLAGMYWHVEQMYNKIYESEKLPFTLDKKYYGLGRDVSLVMPSDGPSRNVVDVLKELQTNPNTTIYAEGGDSIKTLLTNRFYIPFDKKKMAAKGIYPAALVDSTEGRVEFSINIPDGNRYEQLIRNELMLLDLLGTNAFERPLYVMNPRYLQKVFPDITRYIRQEGLLYRIVPYAAEGRFDIDKSYDLMMNRFTWGNIKKEGVYLEEAVTMSNARNMRQNYVLLANNLIDKGDITRANKVLDKAMEEFPNSKVPFDRYDISLVEAYLKAGNKTRAGEVLNHIITYYESRVNYFSRFKGKKAMSVEGEKQVSMYILAEIGGLAQKNGMQKEYDRVRSVAGIDILLESYKARDLFSTYIDRVNETTAMAATDRQQAEERFMQLLSDLEKNILKIGDAFLNEKAGSMIAHIYGVASTYSLDKVKKQIEGNPALVEVLNGYALAQQDN